MPKGRQVSKNRLSRKLATKAGKIDPVGHQRLAVFDGTGGNRMVLPSFHKSPEWAGFVGKFPRIRTIEPNTEVLHIRMYLSQFTQADFVETD